MKTEQDLRLEFKNETGAHYSKNEHENLRQTKRFRDEYTLFLEEKILKLENDGDKN
jgi:hypothetical protein